MTALNIEKKDAWKLWRLAGSRCSFYNCGIELFKEEKEGMRGNMAHIVARDEKEARGHSELTPEERNSYPNLILLCPSHHDLIDANEKEWSVEKLHKMKQEHEQWVKVQLSKGKEWQVHICPGNIHYINLRRLILDPSTFTYFRSWDSTFDFDSIKNLSELGLVQSGQIRMLVEYYLKGWKPPVLSLNGITEENAGARIKFETTFRTKNVPGPYELADFKLKGNISKDPHIYCKIGGRKIYLTIDPRWITTDTAFSLFSSGQVKFSGLGILNTTTQTEARITPIIIGSPDYPGSEYFTGREFGNFGEFGTVAFGDVKY